MQQQQPKFQRVTKIPGTDKYLIPSYAIDSTNSSIKDEVREAFKASQFKGCFSDAAKDAVSRKYSSTVYLKNQILNMGESLNGISEKFTPINYIHGRSTVHEQLKQKLKANEQNYARWTMIGNKRAGKLLPQMDIFVQASENMCVLLVGRISTQEVGGFAMKLALAFKTIDDLFEYLITFAYINEASLLESFVESSHGGFRNASGLICHNDDGSDPMHAKTIVSILTNACKLVYMLVKYKSVKKDDTSYRYDHFLDKFFDEYRSLYIKSIDEADTQFETQVINGYGSQLQIDLKQFTNQQCNGVHYPSQQSVELDLNFGEESQDQYEGLEGLKDIIVEDDYEVETNRVQQSVEQLTQMPITQAVQQSAPTEVPKSNTSDQERESIINDFNKSVPLEFQLNQYTGSIFSPTILNDMKEAIKMFDPTIQIKEAVNIIKVSDSHSNDEDWKQLSNKIKSNKRKFDAAFFDDLKPIENKLLNAVINPDDIPDSNGCESQINEFRSIKKDLALAFKKINESFEFIAKHKSLIDDVSTMPDILKNHPITTIDQQDLHKIKSALNNIESMKSKIRDSNSNADQILHLHLKLTCAKISDTIKKDVGFILQSENDSKITIESYIKSMQFDEFKKVLMKLHSELSSFNILTQILEHRFAEEDEMKRKKMKQQKHFDFDSILTDNVIRFIKSNIAKIIPQQWTKSDISKVIKEISNLIPVGSKAAEDRAILYEFSTQSSPILYIILNVLAKDVKVSYQLFGEFDDHKDSHSTLHSISDKQFVGFIESFIDAKRIPKFDSFFSTMNFIIHSKADHIFLNVHPIINKSEDVIKKTTTIIISTLLNESMNTEAKNISISSMFDFDFPTEITSGQQF